MYTLSNISTFLTNLRTQIPFGGLLVLGFMLAACDSNSDTPELPTASFTTTEQEVSEGASAELIVQLNEVFSEDILVPFTITSNANPDDYVITPSPLKISADSTTAVIEVSSIDDDLTEEPDTLFVSLDEPTNAVLGDPLMLRLTVIDND